MPVILCALFTLFGSSYVRTMLLAQRKKKTEKKNRKKAEKRKDNNLMLKCLSALFPDSAICSWVYCSNPQRRRRQILITLCAAEDFCSVIHSCVFSFKGSGDLKCTVYTCSLLSFGQVPHLSGVQVISRLPLLLQIQAI